MKKLLVFLFILSSSFLFSQEILLNIIDKPNDDGSALILSWDTSQIEASKIIIEREAVDGEFISITNSEEATGTFEDGSKINPGIRYEYKLTAFDNNGEIMQINRTTGESSAQWFNKNKISLLILALLISLSIVYYIFSARSGKDLYIRKIGGLESMDESVGRATEMGRPILFIPGTLDLDDMQTIAGLTLLRRLAQKAAEYDTKLIVPVCRSMVLSTAKEVVKEAYMKAGRPDAYDSDSVFYLTDDQFGYVA